jgi:hypothetical protein
LSAGIGPKNKLPERLPFRTSRGTGIVDSFHHTEDRESGSFDVGRLGADDGRHGLDCGGIGLGALQHGKDARFDDFATFTVSLAAAAKACSTLLINALMFLLSRPFYAGGAVVLR